MSFIIRKVWSRLLLVAFYGISLGYFPFVRAMQGQLQTYLLIQEPAAPNAPENYGVLPPALLQKTCDLLQQMSLLPCNTLVDASGLLPGRVKCCSKVQKES